MFHHYSSKIKSNCLLSGLFLVAFIAGPYAQLDHLLMMPGDIGDARLNNYFLENIYLFIQGNSHSLIHLNFFYPFPYVLGFSDNLFGSSPAYLIPRFLTGEPDTAFQIWFLFGYFVNYIAAYYALRRLGLSVIASAVGALIFTFALPVSAHSGHAQLHYRFGVPLSIAMFIMFLDNKDWRSFAAAMAWLVWQFYCSIYIGFFLLLLLCAMSAVYVYKVSEIKAGALKSIVTALVEQFFKLAQRERIMLILVFAGLAVLMVVLFYPYLQVSSLYHAKRRWGEISSMLPRVQSYFLIANSWLWTSQSGFFSGIPMQHEHQMFIGAVPMLLAISGFVIGRRQSAGLAFPLISGSLVLVVLMTLYVGGFSLWYVLSKLPLASAIRAMSRIILVFLFPVAFLSAVTIDKLSMQVTLAWKILLFAVVSALLFEFSVSHLSSSPKAEWRDRVAASMHRIPATLPDGAILFHAQQSGLFYADELDAMWAALLKGVPTLNGYSGIYPKHYSVEYEDNCVEVPVRILSYLKFSGQQGNEEAYLKLIKRVVPIGFSGCNPDWLVHPLARTAAEREYTAEEFQKLSYEYIGHVKVFGKEYVDLKIINNGNTVISADSKIDKTVNLAWRFIDAEGKPLSDWNNRKNLPFDIPANGNLKIRMPIDTKPAAQAVKLEVSIVQEYVFWGHDVGVKPLLIDLVSE